jgi:hypothetical protein
LLPTIERRIEQLACHVSPLDQPVRGQARRAGAEHPTDFERTNCMLVILTFIRSLALMWQFRRGRDRAVAEQNVALAARTLEL